MTLSLCMIAKGELDNLKRLHPIVKDHIDEWVVVVPPEDSAIDFLESVNAKVVIAENTIDIEPEIREKMLEYIDVPEGHKIFKFADARTQSFVEATGTHILWLDADDNPIGLERLRELVEQSDADMFEAVYDYGKDLEGNSISDHVRERVVKNNGKFKWLGSKLGLIHETITPVDTFAPYIFSVDREDFYVDHISDHVEQSSDRNMIALLYEYLKTDAEDPRTTYYLGTEFFNHKMYAKSIAIMQDYIKVGGWDEERFRAWIHIAEAYHQLGDPESGRNAYLSAQKELPNRPDSYLGLGESYYEEENWGKAIEYLLTGMQKKLPQTKHSVDVTKYTFRPSVFIALSYLQLGKQDEAYNWFVRALKLNPKHPWVAQYKDMFVEAKDLDDYVKSFVKLGQLSKRLYPKTLGKLADSIPDELMDQEVLHDFRRRFSTPKVWSDKSIVYYCSSVMEDWGPDSLKTGCGGSEEAVIQLSKRWAEAGYEVTVFCNTPEEKTVDGVKWVRYERFNPRDIFNIIISWRSNAFLDKIAARKKIIDVHDVPTNKFFPEESLKNVQIFAKSQYHRSLFDHLPDDKFTIIPNGVDLDQFKDVAPKIKNNLVWTSSYDRGLQTLLEMWSDIRTEVPDATIDIAYGFDLFDKSPNGRTLKGQQWKHYMLGLLDQEGVNHHGRLNSEEVSKLYLQADIWAYPTIFPEISCITAIKAQLANCRVITSGYAALQETVKVDEPDLDLSKQANVEQFKKNLIELLKQPGETSELNRVSEQIEAEYSWDVVAKQWVENF